VAVATGISPVDLLECEPAVFWAMVDVLQKQAEQQRTKRR
jgi:hypothetical protein